MPGQWNCIPPFPAIMSSKSSNSGVFFRDLGLKDPDAYLDDVEYREYCKIWHLVEYTLRKKELEKLSGEEIPTVKWFLKNDYDLYVD